MIRCDKHGAVKSRHLHPGGRICQLCFDEAIRDLELAFTAREPDPTMHRPQGVQDGQR